MMSDAVIIALASAFLAFLGIAVNGLVAWNVAKLTTANTKNAQAAAVIVKEVKNKLEETDTIVNKKLTNIKDVADTVHVLVNSNMGIQLKISAAALRRLALLTNDPEDVEAAELAVVALRDHETKQAEADAMKGIEHANS